MVYIKIIISALFLLGGIRVSYVKQSRLVQGNQFETVYGSKGVVSFISSDENYGKNIIIFNDDGTIFSTISLKGNFIKFGHHKISLSGPDLGQTLLDKRFHFSPYEFYPDYNIIRFACKAVRSRRAEIYIDKGKKHTKFINLNSPMFSVVDWKNHLLGAVLEVDNEKNYLRERPSDLLSTKRIQVPDDASFRITKFEGEWAQVECFSFCESTCERKYKGWIRWTNGKQPLLKLYYVC